MTQSCAEKYEGDFALYSMKFDLVLRKLWMIWLVQKIREPNHADHVIGHLVHFNSFLASSNICRLLITFANNLDPDQDWQGSSRFAKVLNYTGVTMQLKRALKLLQYGVLTIPRSGFTQAWKVLEYLEGFLEKSLKIKPTSKSTGKSLKKPWKVLDFYYFLWDLALLIRDLNQYKIAVPLFGA